MTKSEQEQFERLQRKAEKWDALGTAIRNVEKLKEECFSKSKTLGFVWTQRITNELMKFYDVASADDSIIAGKLCNIILAYESLMNIDKNNLD